MFYPSGRVFILGAGASKFAGFPLGRELYSFILDHAGPTISTKWLAYCMESLPLQKRSEAISDIEEFLTRAEEGKLPNYLDRTPVQLQDPQAWKALIPAMRHARANRKPFFRSLRKFVEAELEWLTTGDKVWTLANFIGDIHWAFLAHHACVLHAGRHFHGARYQDPLSWLDLPSWFEHDLRGRCPCANRFTRWRQSRRLKLLARRFRPGDCIITFNWDVLMESILWSENKWSPCDGYGLIVQFDNSQLNQLSDRDCERVLAPSPMKILKPHGSINWVNYAREDSVWELRRLGLRNLGLLFDLPISSTYSPPFDPDPNEDPIGPDPTDWRHTILSPTYRKDYKSEPFLERVWRHITEAIETAKEITVIGYSLPPGDKSARDLLALALSRNSGCHYIDLVSEAGVNHKNWGPFATSVGKELKSGFGTLEEWTAA